MQPMPPTAMIGTLTLRATCQTILSTMGLIAGPERPPTTFPRIGLRRFQSMAIPENVFTSVTASAPASAAACAIAVMSVTLGVNLARIGSPKTSRTPRTTEAVIAGSIPKSTPPLTLGQEMLSSSPASPAQESSLAAMRTNSSRSWPAMFAITFVPSPAR